MSRQSEDKSQTREKRFAKEISHRGLLTKIYEQLLK